MPKNSILFYVLAGKIIGNLVWLALCMLCVMCLMVFSVSLVPSVLVHVDKLVAGQTEPIGIFILNCIPYFFVAGVLLTAVWIINRCLWVQLKLCGFTKEESEFLKAKTKINIVIDKLSKSKSKGG